MSIDIGEVNTVGGDGIKLTATSNDIEITGNNILNCTGYGINIANANCNSNIIVGNDLSVNNSAGNLHDVGTGTKIRGNQGVSDNVVEADIVLANNTTNNVSTARHGFAPILPNDATKFLDGTGAYSVPSGTGANANATYIVQTSTNAPVNAQNLAALTTGVLKSTTATGVVSIAVNTDLPAGDATHGGAVPTPPNNTTTFLRGDMTFAAPPSASLTYKSGTTTKDPSDASATQTIAHGLGKTPAKVKILATYKGTNASVMSQSTTVYNGTTQSSTYMVGTGGNTGYQGTSFLLSVDAAGANSVGVVTFDATNISIAWTKTGSPSSVSFNLLWEAEA